jgi:uncharacterized protein YbjQ (UPF0145 family)
MSSEARTRRRSVLVVTTESVPGYDIVGVVGEVIGIAARSKSPYAEGFVSLRDGAGCGDLARRGLLSGCRWEAVEEMTDEAARLGANAVVAMRFDHRQVTAGWNEVCAYGTAVRIVPTSLAGHRVETGLTLTTAPAPR